jgi:hypothetical protein
MPYRCEFPEKTAYAMDRSLGVQRFSERDRGQLQYQSPIHHRVQRQMVFIYHNGALLPDAGSFHHDKGA